MLGRSVRAVGVVVLEGLGGESSSVCSTWARTRKWGRICGGGQRISRNITCGVKTEMMVTPDLWVNSKNDMERMTKGALDSFDNLRTTHPELEEYSHEEFMPYLEFMSTYGFSDVEAAELLLKCPSLMTSYTEKIPAMISYLQNAGFKETEMTKIIHRHPGMVYLSRSHISSRIGFLNTYFSLGETKEVIQQSIGALVDHESVVQRKLDYLIIQMSHATKDIVSCRVMDHKFSKIRMRHEFLMRAGLYKPIPYRKLIKVEEKERASKDKRPKYFPPYDIVCSNDSYFLKYCTKGALTVNELAAFEEFFEKEVAEEDEQVDENEDNYDEDNEEGIGVPVDAKKQAEADQFYF